MSFARLRAILQSRLRVKLESTPAVIAEVNKEVTKRTNQFQTKGLTPPPAKTATVVNSIGSRNWSVRPIDLLHKIGDLTTPVNVNLSQLSASWATRRYFWAIAQSAVKTGPFLLSQDARDLDFHQKTLLSDEFGIGFAAMVLEDQFGAGEFVDISIALDDPQIYQNIQQRGRTQPDYLMWSELPNSPYYVVECKGSQSNRATSFDQLRRGLEQVPSIAFGSGARPVVTLVVATCMEEFGTTVFVIDPPPDDHDQTEKTIKSERVAERTGVGSYRVPNAEAFARRIWTAQESSLLKWAGQYREATERDVELRPRQVLTQEMPQSAPIETRKTEFGTFAGRSSIAFPELGTGAIRIFTGVEEELFRSVMEQSKAAQTIASANQPRFREAKLQVRRHSPYSSVGLNGTCMIVEGL
jgi:hypothetical protein